MWVGELGSIVGDVLRRRGAARALLLAQLPLVGFLFFDWKVTTALLLYFVEGLAMVSAFCAMYALRGGGSTVSPPARTPGARLRAVAGFLWFWIVGSLIVGLIPIGGAAILFFVVLDMAPAQLLQAVTGEEHFVAVAALVALAPLLSAPARHAGADSDSVDREIIGDVMIVAVRSMFVPILGAPLFWLLGGDEGWRGGVVLFLLGLAVALSELFRPELSRPVPTE